MPQPPTTVTPRIPTVRISTPASVAFGSSAAGYDTSIRHLCKALSSCGSQARVLGALEDAHADQAYSVAVDPTASTAATSIALSELLQTTTRSRLTRRESYAIALTISSSHLQLASTAWIKGEWTADDVLFPLVAHSPSLDRPFISAGFEDAKSRSQSVKAPTDRTFAALGIMLLELCGRRSIEENAWWQKLGFDESQKSQSLYRLVVAAKWSEDVETEEGVEMASAIKWCLNESPRSLDGEQWRRDLADRVVLPIQNCCQYLSKGL